MGLHHCDNCECTNHDSELEELQEENEDLLRQTLKLQNMVIAQDRQILELTQKVHACSTATPS